MISAFTSLATVLPQDESLHLDSRVNSRSQSTLSSRGLQAIQKTPGFDVQFKSCASIDMRQVCPLSSVRYRNGESLNTRKAPVADIVQAVTTSR